MHPENKPSGFPAIFLVALTCIFSGSFVGATTNMINGAVSPDYFRQVLEWEFEGIWFASILQGFFEGLLYGILFSAVFTTAFGIITKGKASYGFAFRQLLKVLASVYCCWLIGGLIGVILAALSPEFFTSHFPFNAPNKTGLLKFAWVGGSIWGGMFGGFLNLFFGIILIKNNWQKAGN